MQIVHNIIFNSHQEIGKRYLELYNSTEEIKDSTNLQIFSLLSFMDGLGYTPIVSYLENEEVNGSQGNLGFIKKVAPCFWQQSKIIYDFKSFKDAVRLHNKTISSWKIVKKVYLQINKKQKPSKVVTNKFLVEFGIGVKQDVR